MRTLPLMVITIGLGLWFVDQWLNVEFWYTLSGGFTPFLAGVVAVGLTGLFGYPVIRMTIQQRDPIMFALAALLFAAASISSLGASLYRAGAVLAGGKENIQTMNISVELAEDAYKDALNYRNLRREARDVECSTGRRDRCADRETELTAAEYKLAAARSARARAGVRKNTDPLVQIVQASTGLDEKTIRKVFDPSLPVALWLGSIVFFHTGLKGFSTKRKPAIDIIEPSIDFELSRVDRLNILRAMIAQLMKDGSEYPASELSRLRELPNPTGKDSFRVSALELLS